jgi:hypothetical protein
VSARSDEPGGDTQHAAGPPSIRNTREYAERADRGKSSLDEEVISDFLLNGAERGWQRRFIVRPLKWLFLLSFLLLARDHRYEGPDRSPMPDRVVEVRFTSLELDGLGLPPSLRLRGAWRVGAEDPRFAGLSGLAVLPSGRMLAISDSGVWIDLPRPGRGSTAGLQDFAGGPGTPIFKKHRDSEALLVEDTTRLVTFEFRHSLWRYPLGGQAKGWRLPRKTLTRNSGIEAMLRDSHGRLLLLPEQGEQILAFDPASGLERPALRGRTGGISDAATLADGRMIVALRQVTLLGLRNDLAWLEPDGSAYRLRPFATLPLGPFDNVEGLAAEPLPGGGTRLWAVTDSDGWRRTLLLELEIAALPASSRKAGRTKGPAQIAPTL